MKTTYRYNRGVRQLIAMGLLLFSSGCQPQSRHPERGHSVPRQVTKDSPVMVIPAPGDGNFETPSALQDAKGHQTQTMVMGFYVDYSAASCLNDLREHPSLYTDVSTITFTLNQRGRLTGHQPARKLFANHARTYLTVTNNFNAPAIHTLLRNAALRSRFITDLTAFATDEPYTGVDLDLEHIPSKDMPLYLTFLHALANDLHSHRLKLIIVSPLNFQQEKVARQLGQVADDVILMAYDYTYITESPGPLAPSWWVKQGIEQWLRLVPRSKLILGIGAYGYDWGGSANHARSLPQIDRQLLQDHVHVMWDTQNSAPYFTYRDHQNKRHIVYYENKESLKLKIELAKQDHLAGVSLWRLGLEDSATDILLASLRQP